MFTFQCVCVCVCACARARAWSCPTLFDLIDYSPFLSMEFSRQEYWSGLPFPPPKDLPKPGIEPATLVSPSLADDSLSLHHLGSPYIPVYFINVVCL